MRTRVLERTAVAETAAEYVCCYADNYPGTLIGLDVSTALQPVYEALGRAAAEGRFKPETMRYCAVRGVPGADYSGEKLRAALSNAGIPENRCMFLTDATVEGYDEEIRNAGGLGLVLLSVEEKGRIGFNEPSSAFDTETRSVPVTPRIRKELERDYPADCLQTVEVLTMGIHTITRARNTLVVACGGERADAAYRMLYGRDDSTVPAAFLQLNAEVLVLLDEEAGSLLGKDRLIV